MKNTLLFFFFFSNLFLFSQKSNLEKFEVTAKVVEASDNHPLEYATFVFTHIKSKKVFGGITDVNGNFSIQIPKGTYTVKVEFIGFKTKNLPQQTITTNKNLGTIKLSEDAEVLDEVEIVAEKSTVEIKLDKKIFNVGKDATVKGGNASDVLDNVPSVSVDAEGTVSLRGNENVRILIDGKPSALAGLNGTDALRNLPADAIEKVEVITSPSARYDAEGTGGLLNIILRKEKATGFNGSLSLTVGHPDQVNIVPNLNYRTKKINLFTSLGYLYRQGPGFANYETTFLDDNGNPESYNFQDRDYTRTENDYNATIGLEYFINKKSSITGTFVYQNANQDIDSENKIFTGTNIDALTFDSTRDLLETENEFTKQYSLNYTNNFNDKGHKLTADLQFSDSYEREASEVFDDGIKTIDGDEFTESKNYLLQIDYVLPLSEKSQLELGHKVEAEFNDGNFDTTDDAGNFVQRVLEFDQTIYAYYAQYGTKLGKFSFLTGLRAETTDINIELESIDNLSTQKNFTKLFPTINLGYELNENENITLGFNRRIRRPRSRFLNPFPSQSSETFIFLGNPDLIPTFTNAVELGYYTKIKKLDLGSSVYYQHSIDPISVVSRTVDDGTLEIRQPINLDSQSRYGFEFTANYSPAKWLRLSSSFNFFAFNTEAFSFNYLEDGIENTIDLEEVKSSSWFTRFNSRVTLPGKIQWQTQLMYRAKFRRPQSDRLPRFNTNLAFTKDILKEKATLTLSVRDLFNTRKLELITYNEDRVDPESITELEFQWRVRQINLNFVYRFNQKKKKEKPQRMGGDGDF